jgi:TadE-like protein
MTINLYQRQRRQGGVFAVEFAMLAVIFFIFLFAMLEVARAVYLWNMVHEVTRRAARGAAVADFSNAAALQAVREQAILRVGPGRLPLGGGISDAYVRIDYLSQGSGSTPLPLPVSVLPGCPQRNRINCLNDPHGASCIRFVRARLCVPGGGAGQCERVPYRPILPMLDMMFPSGAQAVRLPSGATMAVAESLGYHENAAFCP